MSNAAREAAREAVASRRSGEPPNDFERRISELEAIVADQAEALRSVSSAFQEMYDAMRTQLSSVKERTLANERMISVKTIETLARAQVARIMSEEREKKGGSE